jgi:hypothetical protein
VWRHSVESVTHVGVESISEVHWSWGHILVWVESTETTRKSSQISNRGDLDHLVLLVVWVELRWAHVASRVLMVLVVVSLVLVETLHFLWHWRKGDTFWEIWKWIDELSFFSFSVKERASITELAFSFIHEVFARFSLVVRVDSTESGLTKVLWKCLNYIWIRIQVIYHLHH